METSANNPTPVVVGNCVSCNGLVRVPTSVNANSTVRCPHCSGMFKLVEVLNESIPELVVEDSQAVEIDDRPYIDRIAEKEKNLSQNDGKKIREKFVVPTQLSQGAKRKRRHRRSKSKPKRQSKQPEIANGTPDSQFAMAQTDTDQIPEISTGDRSSDSPRPVSQSSRRRHSRTTRKKKKAIVELIQIICGGLLAFPVAYLLLMWGLGIDPINIGPALGSVVPGIVPEGIRQPDKEEKEEKTGPGFKTKTSEDINWFDVNSHYDEEPIIDVSPEGREDTEEEAPDQNTESGETPDEMNKLDEIDSELLLESNEMGDAEFLSDPATETESKPGDPSEKAEAVAGSKQ